MVLLNKIKDKLNINYRKKRWPGLIEAYKQYLPVTKKTPIISLNEGNTPLIFSDSIRHAYFLFFGAPWAILCSIGILGLAYRRFVIKPEALGKFSSTSPAIWVIAILSVVSFAVS